MCFYEFLCVSLFFSVGLCVFKCVSPCFSGFPCVCVCLCVPLRVCVCPCLFCACLCLCDIVCVCVCVCVCVLLACGNLVIVCVFCVSSVVSDVCDSVCAQAWPCLPLFVCVFLGVCVCARLCAHLYVCMFECAF